MVIGCGQKTKKKKELEIFLLLWDGRSCVGGFMIVKNDFNEKMSGYLLLDCGSYFELHFKGGLFRGTLDQIMAYAQFNMDFCHTEIRLAHNEMRKRGDDGAQFGIFKTFMWTFKQKRETLVS